MRLGLFIFFVVVVFLRGALIGPALFHSAARQFVIERILLPKVLSVDVVDQPSRLVTRVRQVPECSFSNLTKQGDLIRCWVRQNPNARLLQGCRLPGAEPFAAPSSRVPVRLDPGTFGLPMVFPMQFSGKIQIEKSV